MNLSDLIKSCPGQEQSPRKPLIYLSFFLIIINTTPRRNLTTLLASELHLHLHDEAVQKGGYWSDIQGQPGQIHVTCSSVLQPQLKQIFSCMKKIFTFAFSTPRLIASATAGTRITNLRARSRPKTGTTVTRPTAKLRNGTFWGKFASGSLRWRTSWRTKSWHLTTGSILSRRPWRRACADQPTAM